MNALRFNIAGRRRFKLSFPGAKLTLKRVILCVINSEVSAPSSEGYGGHVPLEPSMQAAEELI